MPVCRPHVVQTWTGGHEALLPIGGRLVPVPRQRDLALETKERS